MSRLVLLLAFFAFTGVTHPVGAESFRDALRKKVKEELKKHDSEKKDDSRKSSSRKSSSKSRSERDRDRDDDKDRERDSSSRKDRDDRDRDDDRDRRDDDDRDYRYHRQDVYRGYDGWRGYGYSSRGYGYAPRYESYRAPVIIYSDPAPPRYYRSYDSTPPPVIYPDDYGNFERYRGASSRGISPDLIAGVQSRLASLGLYRGAIDGIAGSGTRNGIQAFQRQNGLPVTGRIDSELLQSLGLPGGY